MKLVVKQSEFDVPAGRYLAKFLGIKELANESANPRLGRDNKPMPPAVAWLFEVIDGEYRGRKVDRVTGAEPTTKNVCGRLLAQITDVVLKEGTDIDLQPFVGKIYRIIVETKECGGVRVSDLGLRRFDSQPSLPGVSDVDTSKAF